mmetsp:Transcript_4872/g.12147  ORF Transcript_4872/g.12147 Transcript_4872/m.12147 type:complete len:117 (+) Transcript_4872:257-607(+)
MKSQREFRFENPQGTPFCFQLQELVEGDFGFYTWPCSVELVSFLLQNTHLVRDRRVLELGCGTALVSLAAAALGCSAALATDLAHPPEILENCARNVGANSAASRLPVRVLPLECF